MAQETNQQTKRDFVKYTFYKVAPEWRELPEADRTWSKSQFAGVVAEFSDRITISTYSLVGTRADVDLMLWKVSPTLEAINELMSQINRTELGKFLNVSHSFLAMTRRSPYVDHHAHDGQEGASATMRIVGRKYLFVYPFLKTN